MNELINYKQYERDTLSLVSYVWNNQTYLANWGTGRDSNPLFQWYQAGVLNLVLYDPPPLNWSHRQGSNLQHPMYKIGALPIELWWLEASTTTLYWVEVIFRFRTLHITQATLARDLEIGTGNFSVHRRGRLLQHLTLNLLLWVRDFSLFSCNRALEISGQAEWTLPLLPALDGRASLIYYTTTRP